MVSLSLRFLCVAGFYFVAFGVNALTNTITVSVAGLETINTPEQHLEQ